MRSKPNRVLALLGTATIALAAILPASLAAFVSTQYLPLVSVVAIVVITLYSGLESILGSPKIRRIIRQLSHPPGPALRSLLEDVARRFKLPHTRIRLFVFNDPAAPVALSMSSFLYSSIAINGMLASPEISGPDGSDAVISHEMAHIYARDSLFYFTSRLATQFFTVLTLLSILLVFLDHTSFLIPLAAILASVLNTLWLRALSRRLEYRADAYAVWLGAPRSAMISILAATPCSSGALSSLASLFSTHPSHARRIERIRAL